MNDTSLPYQLHKLVHLMDRRADETLLRRYGLTYRRGYFLLMLGRLQPTSQRRLATSLGYQPASVSVMLRELKDAGYVEIKVDPLHQKRHIASLTSTGERIVKDATTYLDAEFEHIIEAAQLNKARFIDDVEKIYNALGDKKEG
jgi:DNA-binding MarR family transcriptional regulator